MISTGNNFVFKTSEINKPTDWDQCDIDIITQILNNLDFSKYNIDDCHGRSMMRDHIRNNFAQQAKLTGFSIRVNVTWFVGADGTTIIHGIGIGCTALTRYSVWVKNHDIDIKKLTLNQVKF